VAIGRRVDRVRTLAIALAAFVLAAMVAGKEAHAGDPIEAQHKYQAFCAECHGRYGRGDGPTSLILETKPRNFGDCDRMAKISNQLMLDVIKNGGYANNMSADMPAWRYALSEDDMRDLVVLIRKFCTGYAAMPPAAVRPVSNRQR
jgi:cytochrome c oxidase cbb3-type subunit 3